MRHNPAYGIMTELMKGRTVPVDGFEVSLRRRDLDVIVRGYVESAFAADAEIDPGGFDQCLDLWLDQRLRTLVTRIARSRPVR